jgi:hypothetical protein
MLKSQDEIFAIRIREYYYKRLGVQFIASQHGFCGFSVSGTDMCIDELYVDEGTNIIHSLALVRRAIRICKQRGCTRLIGGNETSLDSYADVRKLHEWFGMTYLSNNGSLELWSKPI